VLFGIYESGQDVSGFMNGFMVVVGIIFVINSLDSLTRLYTENLQLTTERFGKMKYIGLHWLMLYGLILAYHFTPLEIEWIGLVVIGLYAVIAVLVILRKQMFERPVSS